MEELTNSVKTLTERVEVLEDFKTKMELASGANEATKEPASSASGDGPPDSGGRRRRSRGGKRPSKSRRSRRH